MPCGLPTGLRLQPAPTPRPFRLRPAAPRPSPQVYNSGLVSALAGMAEYFDVQPWSGELQEAKLASQVPGYAAYVRRA